MVPVTDIMTYRAELAVYKLFKLVTEEGERHCGKPALPPITLIVQAGRLLHVFNQLCAASLCDVP